MTGRSHRGVYLTSVAGRAFLLMAVLYLGCSPEAGVSTAPTQAHTHFDLLDPTETGVTFRNDVEDRPDFNILTYRNYYNGGGVAIGDINNDGLPDLYFTANLTPNKLYLNKGDFNFEDITTAAGVGGTKAWSTGVTMGDVNGDGLLDIYVSNSGDLANDNKENELFINNGDLTFTEQAAEYGLNNQGYSTQAAFFDYDADGDLDCYLLNNSFKDPSKIELFRSMRDRPDPLGGDKLYRNDHGRFVDVTTSAGIYSSEIGFGLGASIGDINHDFLPDIYVSNDFWERDYLYVNQGDGTFSEELIDRIDFCSISSMGGDIADINNDGHPEIISTDMLAADNYRLKAMSSFDPYHLENMKYRANYHYQIGQNCLHLNDGTGDFQEIAMLSNVAATDWSWGALFFDFENDGWKDLFISNGLQKDLMYMDFRDFLSDNDIYRKIAQNQTLDYPSLVAQMPSNPLKNYAFANRRGIQFEEQADELGLSQETFSNGSAYGDLDNDGDMDLVINNVNMPAYLYRNEAEKVGHHHLTLMFEGPSSNPFGIGAHVKVVTAEGTQTMQNFNTRGFQSSVEPHLTFGLGPATSVDRLEVTWPDQRRQHLTDVSVDQALVLRYEEAAGAPLEATEAQPTFAEVTDTRIVGNTAHRENRYNDFDHEILLPRMLSTEGPRMVVGDVNGDGRDDLVLMGAKHDPDKLFLQEADGVFRSQASQAFQSTVAFESTCGAFLDFDQDGDQDLLLGSGGNESLQGNQFYIVRYYDNDGQGNFTLDMDRKVPRAIGNFSCLEVADYDQDGDLDLFLGARTIPGNYGLPPRSYLFKNQDGTWVDQTPDAIAGMGMVTDACWTDIDQDQDPDLVVVGDWMGVRIFKNVGGVLAQSPTIPGSEGWWTRVEPADLDADGDTDFVLGNWGTNSKLKASASKPLTMYVNDFDGNGKSEFIINWYAPLDNRAYPFAAKMDMTQQLPELRKRSLRYEDYARQTYETLFEEQVRQSSLAFQVQYLQSAILWNEGSDFALEALPVEAQVAPVFGIVAADLTDNGHLDIWLGGNFYGLKPQVGRHDASKGVLLEGLGSRTFRYLDPVQSGIRVEGEVRDAAVVDGPSGPTLVIARNNDTVLMFNKTTKPTK